MKKMFLIVILPILLLCSCGNKPEVPADNSAADDSAVTQGPEILADMSSVDYIGSGEYMTYSQVKNKYSDKTILRWQVCMGAASIPTDLVNEYIDSLGKDYAVCFEPLPPSFASGKGYIDSIKEMISSGNQPDIINSWLLSKGETAAVSPYSGFVGEGIFADISELLHNTECGRLLYELMPGEYWDSLKIGGKIYGVDGYMSCVFPARYVIYNKSLTEKYGFDTAKPLFSQQDAILEIVQKEGCNGVLISDYDLSNVQSTSRGSAWGMTYFDETDDCFKSLLENKDYLQFLETVYEMTKNGSCANLFTVTNDELSAKKPYFAYITASVGAFEGDTYMGLDQKPFDTEVVELFPATITNTNTATGICQASEHKEQAFDLLCLTQTDKYLCELLSYGVEENRVYTGEAVDLPGRFYEYLRFMNSMLCTPYVNNYFVISKESIENAFVNGVTDPVMGFDLDTSQIYDEFISCDKIVSDYYSNMDDYIISSESFDELIKDYGDKLERAGLRAVIDESNAQYNQWRRK